MPDIIAARAATASFVPAQEVVDELKVSPLPRAAKTAMASLSVETLLPMPGTGLLAWPYEWSPFRCLFGFKEWTGSLAAFPPWGGVFVTAPDGSQSHTSAAGVWQDEEGTYADITTRTGRLGFTPQDQIANNWVLAVRDFAARTGGGDLLATLEAGELDKVSPALSATWPEGADANFPARYVTALALFPADTPPPGPPPPSTDAIEILLGDQCAIPITAAVDKNGTPVAVVPADLMTPDDASICTAAIANATLTVETHALGTTTLRGADQVLTFSVVPPAVAHLQLDLAHAVYSPMVAVAKAMIARLPAVVMVAALMIATASQITELPMSAVAPERAMLPHPRARLSILAQAPKSIAGPPTFGSVAFCLQPDQSATAIERCLRWTAALSHR